MKKIILWGTGKIANEVLNDCKTLNQYDIVGIIDNNEQKWNTIFENIEVLPPSVLNGLYGITVVILTDAFDEIKYQIDTQYGHCNIDIENKYFFYKESLLKRYEESKDVNVQEVISYIKEHGLGVFNYNFVEKYKSKVDVQLDKESGLYYVIHNGKKMYFSRALNSKKSVNYYYNSILLEQDEKSPHKYMTKNIHINEGDVVVDVGVAEGNFSLEIIDKVSKLYLVETDEKWIEALHHTFKAYRDKVTIIKGFVSSYCDGNIITLDSIIEENVNFIKMDIEGNEWDALQGAERIIKKSKNINLAICAYHSDFDQELIESFMIKNNIKHWPSDGYMWFPYKLRQTYVSTKLNKGIIFGHKE